MKPGNTIKLLENVYDKNRNVILSEFDLIKILKITKDKIQVSDILDNTYWIPSFIKYKISNKKLPNVAKKSKVKLKAAPLVTPTPNLKESTQINNLLRKAGILNTAMAQVIVVNALSSDDVVNLLKLSIASNILTLSTSNGATLNNVSKLQQLAKKLIAEV